MQMKRHLLTRVHCARRHRPRARGGELRHRRGCERHGLVDRVDHHQDTRRPAPRCRRAAEGGARSASDETLLTGDALAR